LCVDVSVRRVGLPLNISDGNSQRKTFGAWIILRADMFSSENTFRSLTSGPPCEDWQYSAQRHLYLHSIQTPMWHRLNIFHLGFNPRKEKAGNLEGAGFADLGAHSVSVILAF
jgi:hypothetical protein